MKPILLPLLFVTIALGLASGVPFFERVALATCWVVIFAACLIATEARALLDQWIARPWWSVWPARLGAMAVAICLAGFAHWVTLFFFVPVVLFTALATTGAKAETQS